ncbi:MAG: glycosyltransferase family 4 protein [Ferruginibacter sp.]
MHILIFYQYFGTPKGGWSTRMYELPKRWIEAGHKVTVVTSPYDKSDIKAEKFIEKQDIDGIEVIIVNIKQSNKHSLIYRAFTFAMFSLISIYYALTFKFNVILCSSGPITIGLPGLFAKLFRPKKKLVFEVRDLWPDGAIQLGLIKNKLLIKVAYYFEKLFYKKADLIVTCSQGMSDSIIERVNPKNIITIPNACDIEFFREKDIRFKLPDWAVNKKIFVYTGSLGLMDDCMQIIKGIELVNFPDVVFVFIGEGKEKFLIEDYVMQKQIPQVHFLGLIPKTEVRSWLQHAYAAFVTFKNIPVLQTSSPNKMFDAFAAGVPVVQSTNGWIKTMLNESETGISVNPTRPTEMATAITKLYSFPELRNQMASNSRQLAVNSFDRKKLALTYLTQIEQLVTTGSN